MTASTSERPGALGAAEAVPLCSPEIHGNEWNYIRDCLDTGWVSSVGTYVDRFERCVAEAVGARYAVATVNGTSALHIALLTAGVERDDEVLIPSLSFIAPANAIRYAGAWPLFMDIEPVHRQLDVGPVIDFLMRACVRRDYALYNRATGRRVRAILPVHILGHPVDLDPLLDIAGWFDLPVIEDATESLGATYHGRAVGHLGTVACFSFNGNKLITTGGGGMLVTDDETIARRARYLTTQAKDDPVEYIHREIGYNYRLTNIQAAMGVAQMEQLPDFLAAKRRIAGCYTEALAEIPGLEPMREAPWASSAWWLYTIGVDAERFGTDARGLMRALAARLIQTRPLWQPLHQSPAHAAAPAMPCPVAEEAYRSSISLPCSVGLAPAAQAGVIAAIREIGASALSAPQPPAQMTEAT
jgi:perosamine synthetase